MRNPAAILGGMMALGMAALPIRRYRDSADWPKQTADDALSAEEIDVRRLKRTAKPVATTVSEPIQRPVSRQVRRRAERLAKKREAKR